MGFSSWLCTNNTKGMYVKIVYPGRVVELHDRPVMAAEIMFRNPKSIIAHPNVFKQPWAIVAPETMLCLGQKFYVVPVSTIRKLQGSYSCPKDEKENECINSQTSWKKGDSPGENLSKDRLTLDENLLMSMIPVGSKVNGNGGGDDDDDDSSEEASSSKEFNSSKIKGHTRKKSKGLAKGSPKKFVATMENWQPSLESIIEEV